VLRTGVLCQPLPERCLPVLRLVALPRFDPVRPIDEVLVEQFAEPCGELEASKLVTVDVAIYRCEGGECFELREQTQDAPREDFRVELRLLGHVAAHCAIELPRKRRRVGKAHICANACPLGEPKRKPACDAAALDDHDFAREWRRERHTGDGSQLIGKGLEPVAVVDGEHRTA